MTKTELLIRLQTAISETEWEQLQNRTLPVSDFNHEILMEIKDAQPDKENTSIDIQAVENLTGILRNYLSQHLSDKPHAWKYIIICCIYLTFITQRPMHPIEKLDIKVTESKEGTLYECPQKSSKKDTSCYFCVCKKLSNYEIAKRNTQKQFPKYDHRKIAEKLGIPFENNSLYLEFLGRRYRICCQTGYVEWFENTSACGHEADFNEVMVLYDILCYSMEGAAPANEFTLLEQLSSIQNASAYVGDGLFKKEELFWDQKSRLLSQAFKELNGTEYGKGDISYRIPVFQSLDVVFSFWNSDEDFPAQIKFYCDKNILQYMHFETVWYLIAHMMQRIREIAKI